MSIYTYCKKTLLLIFLFLPFTILLDAEETTIIPLSSYGIDEYTSISELCQRVVPIFTLTEKNKGSGFTLLESDYHFVSELPLPLLSRRLIDLDNAAKLFDRIIYSKDLTPKKSLKYPHIQEVHTSYKFFGIGTEYRYKVRVYFDIVSENEFAMRWELYDPMNSSINKIYGSWYLKTININGKSETYIRSFGATLLANAPRGILFFTRIFGKSEIERTFRNLLKEQ